ncbi:unnamed protein product [Spirodela intermedia]|uniref:ribonuclease P n=1 Tax=Spirodela intermedia TaxID=51605 RepID=A0A7I8IT76_SPIIN|nr:unnamed protein product [Spirodela intermedia]CAA6661005.1 unnamed protein product [Spirodela intermedia]
MAATIGLKAPRPERFSGDLHNHAAVGGCKALSPPLFFTRCGFRRTALRGSAAPAAGRSHANKVVEETSQSAQAYAGRTSSGDGGAGRTGLAGDLAALMADQGFCRKGMASETAGSAGERGTEKASRRSKVSSAGLNLRIGLEMCSKRGDALGAISLFDSSIRQGEKLNQYHYDILLYLCASAAVGVVHPAKSGRSCSHGTSSDASRGLSSESDRSSIARASSSPADSPYGGDNFADDLTVLNGSVAGGGGGIQVTQDVRNYALKRGFEIYEKMCQEEIPMSEAALTSILRPALFAYCNTGDIEKAFEVERHMAESGVHPEEPELQALLKISVEARRAGRVYYALQKLRTCVRRVSATTAELIESWFKSPIASRVGKRKWDRKLIEEASENGGGGWHGQGWLGQGRWTVKHGHVDAHGICESCGEKLVAIDLDPIETESFARSVASIAGKRERNSSFQQFQKWLDYHGPFEAVIDAANVGLFSQRSFSLSKVNRVVNGIRQKLPSKSWPLVVVHNRRVSGKTMDDPINGKLLEKWRNADAIYATPTGSNDDWYWLYAAIKCKGLIVTNDEMRDHIFQLLGDDVHFSFRDGNPEILMPPPCSIVIQESVNGHWHIPIAEEHESDSQTTWLCITRDDTRRGTTLRHDAVVGNSTDSGFEECSMQ